MNHPKPSLPGTDQWPNVAKEDVDAKEKAAFDAFWYEQKMSHGSDRPLPTCTTVARWLFRAGYEEGRKPDTTAEILGSVQEDLLDQARALLQEISDSGYIKTKQTWNETNLEERVDAFLNPAK